MPSLANSLAHGASIAFRVLGDFVHVLSILVLFKKMHRTASCSGLSLKTQALLLAVFLARYSDICVFFMRSVEVHLLEVYNTAMKILLTSLQAYVVYCIAWKYSYSYAPEFDDERTALLVAPALLGALFLKSETRSAGAYALEFLWAFSVILESIAILPQLLLLRKTGEVETLTFHYVVLLGLYRALHIVGWVFKALSGRKILQILFCASIVQTLLYTDFFVVYFRHFFWKRKKASFSLRDFARNVLL